MRADGKWQCSELTGQPTYLLATATGTVSDYSDAFGIDNHVYDFAFIRLILKALQLGLPLADHRRRFEHRPDPVTRRLLFLCRSQSCRVGITSESWPRGYTWGAMACPPLVVGIWTVARLLSRPVVTPPPLQVLAWMPSISPATLPSAP